MDNIAELKLKSQLLRDIESTVSRYESDLGIALSLANLNRKFGKRAKPYGGIILLVEELERNGILIIEISKTGGYDLNTPGFETEKLSNM